MKHNLAMQFLVRFAMGRLPLSQTISVAFGGLFLILAPLRPSQLLVLQQAIWIVAAAWIIVSWFAFMRAPSGLKTHWAPLARVVMIPSLLLVVPLSGLKTVTSLEAVTEVLAGNSAKKDVTSHR